MAGIFGGQSSSRGGGLQGSMQGPAPRNFAGDQAGGMDLAKMWDAVTWQPPKEYEASPLAAAPRDQYGDIMANARAQADATSYINNQKIADAERTRQHMVANTENWYGQMTGTNAPQFAHMLPAYAMHGIDVMQGRGTGWDQYAALAGGGQGAQAQAGQNLRQQEMLQHLGNQPQPYQPPPRNTKPLPPRPNAGHPGNPGRGVA